MSNVDAVAQLCLSNLSFNSGILSATFLGWAARCQLQTPALDLELIAL